MSESLNQGWNEAIAVLALLGLWGVCLGLAVILILLLSLSAEREPGEKQQASQSQSRQIVGVPGMQCKDTEARECCAHRTTTHTHMRGSFCCLRERQSEQMPFHTEGWKIPIKLILGSEIGHCLSALGFFICLSGARDIHVQQILARLVVDHFIAVC